MRRKDWVTAANYDASSEEKGKKTNVMSNYCPDLLKVNIHFIQL